MRTIVPIIIIGILLFGCISIGQKAESGKNTTYEASQNRMIIIEDIPQTGQVKCNDSYAFSRLPETVLSQNATFAVTATCASGKSVSVYIDGEKRGEKLVGSDPASLVFALVAKKDGSSKIEVKADGITVHTMNWSITAIGFFDTTGLAADPVSVKQWKAVAFDVENTVTINTVGLYMKRLEANTMSGTEIVVELHSDNNGNPGDWVLSGSTLNITKTTLTNNWISFALNRSTTLAKGRYWLVVKLWHPTSPIVSDVVNMHYVSGLNNIVPGNGYHRQMSLKRNDTVDRWEETKWEPLAYDKRYNFMVSAG